MSHVRKCLCGHIQFSIDAEPLGARMCWCRDCQRIASGSATVNVLFPEESVQYTGQMTTLRLTADSGNIVEPVETRSPPVIKLPPLDVSTRAIFPTGIVRAGG